MSPDSARATMPLQGTHCPLRHARLCNAIARKNATPSPEGVEMICTRRGGSGPSEQIASNAKARMGLDGYDGLKARIAWRLNDRGQVRNESGLTQGDRCADSVRPGRPGAFLPVANAASRKNALNDEGRAMYRIRGCCARAVHRWSRHRTEDQHGERKVQR